MALCVWCVIVPVAVALCRQVDDRRFHHIHIAPERWAVQGCLPTDIMTHYMEDTDWAKIDELGVMHC